MDTFIDYDELRIIVGNVTASGRYSIGVRDDTDARTFEVEETNGDVLEDLTYDYDAEAFVQRNYSAHARLQKVSQVVPRVVERLLERLTDGLRYQVANDLRIEEVELEFEFGEGGSDERLEIRVRDEEVEEYVLWTERVSENGMDGGDRSSEVLDVKSNGDVDGRSGWTATSGRERSPDRRSRT
ncbi:hypothetical protein Syun_014108 [Stephania yunnanensis]|uniref:Uncharacterized protein n=1 Tax=Stephania yunnanensis TaxID=152371 RepID=A0AAP0JKD7_9MAGN